MTISPKLSQATATRPKDHPQDAATAPMTGRQALVSAALSQTQLTDLTKILASESPRIVLINVPSPAWAKSLGRHLHWTLDTTSAHAIYEIRKGGNQSLANELTEDMVHGHHLVLLSHDPQTLIPTSLLSAVDFELALGAPTVKMMRRAIHELTGEATVVLRSSDFAGLDFDALALALRAGSTSRECVRRLRRAKVTSRSVSNARVGPTFATLPLSADIKSWSDSLLADLKRVDAGKMDPADLTYPLLEGPPGTGKTLIATALAHSSGWRLVQTSVGAWFANTDGHLGSVSRAMTEFFNELLRAPQTVGFIDELDAIPNRSVLSEKDRDFWTPVVTLFLLQIDRVRLANRPLLLVGATNYFDRLDAALIRSGRLEQRVAVLPPHSTEEVAAILRHYLKGEFEHDIVAAVARLCQGKTPADIESLVRQARSHAASEGRPLEADDLLNRVLPPDLRSAEELEATAVHEAGHAVVSLMLGLPVKAVSIIAQGERGGFMQGAINSHIPNRTEVEAMTTVMLGGRAADVVLGKGAHAGAELDLHMATSLLRKAMAEWGLYDTLMRAGSPHALQKLDTQVERLLQSLMKRSIEIVQREQIAVRALAEALLNERLMDAATVARIFETYRFAGNTPV